KPLLKESNGKRHRTTGVIVQHSLGLLRSSVNRNDVVPKALEVEFELASPPYRTCSIQDLDAGILFYKVGISEQLVGNPSDVAKIAGFPHQVVAALVDRLERSVSAIVQHLTDH